METAPKHDDATVTVAPQEASSPALPTSVSMAPAPLESDEIAYTIKDKAFPDFHIRKSHNAWWMDSEKVRMLIAALKNGFDVGDALKYAGISYGQWEYFKEVHPRFSEVREACENIVFQMAEKNSFEGLKKGNLEHTRWFLERRRPEKYGRKELLPPAPGASQSNNFGTVVNVIDPSKLSPAALKVIIDMKNGPKQS